MEQSRHMGEGAEHREGLPAAGQPHKTVHHSIPGHQCKSIQYASRFPAL